MRYITEFEISPDMIDKMHNGSDFVKYRKGAQNAVLGKMIADVVGWEERQPNRHSLEIQAFSMKDWREFKQEIKQWMNENKMNGGNTYYLSVMGRMIEALENKGIEKAGVFNGIS
jgi:hypothetical protein